MKKKNKTNIANYTLIDYELDRKLLAQMDKSDQLAKKIVDKSDWQKYIVEQLMLIWEDEPDQRYWLENLIEILSGEYGP